MLLIPVTCIVGTTRTKYTPQLEGMKSRDGSVSGAEEAALPMPYQVHRKVMGWKLTSVQRRRNLVGMLDLVNNARHQSSQAELGGSRSDFSSSQIPHSLLRTGHGKRVRVREVPPLAQLTRELAHVQDQQRELQRSQVMGGFQASTQLLSPVRDATTGMKRSSRNSSRKSTGRNVLSASASNLANLAIHVEMVGKFLVEQQEEPAQVDMVEDDMARDILV
jgi:hypothetical protein